MCKLIVGVNNKKDNSVFKDYIVSQFDIMKYEKDGVSALLYTFDNKFITFRSLTDYNGVFDNVLKHIDNARFVSIHTRTGTSGLKNASNVHFFDSGDYTIAHNGYVNSYHSYSFGSNYGFYGQSSLLKDGEDIVADMAEDCTGCFTAKAGICRKHKRMIDAVEKKEVTDVDKKPIIAKTSNDMCDTFQFLDNMPKPTNQAIIQEEMEKRGFSGFAVIVNKKTLETWLLVKKEVILKTDKKTFGITYSFNPEDTVERFKITDYLGFETLEKEKEYDLKLPSRILKAGVQLLKIIN